MAAALGVAAQRVTQPAEIVPALRRALTVVAPGSDPAAEAGRPALVEFVTCEETQLSKPW
jgi:acetolactate synthase-1/2/3 large subunit